MFKLATLITVSVVLGLLLLYAVVRMVATAVAMAFWQAFFRSVDCDEDGDDGKKEEGGVQ